MRMNIQSYNETGSTWDAFVASQRYSTNYHQYAWRRVIEKSFGHMTHYLVARNDTDEICGVLPLVHMKSALFGNFLTSLPYVNYGGLLCIDENARATLLTGLDGLLIKLRADHVELRHIGSFVKGLVTKQHKVTMILDLDNEEEVQWQALDAKVRNQVRKAVKCGLRVVTGYMELLDGFYGVFCRNMRDLGTPVYSKDFFLNILAEHPDTTRIISVMLGEKVVASGILSWFRDIMEVPWASSIRDYRELCPNNLLYWEAIRFAIRSGKRKFDFGRSTPGEGTYQFKKQWGAEPVQLYWQYLLKDGNQLPELNPKNPHYELAIKVWQRMPLAMANLLGPTIVRNIP